MAKVEILNFQTHKHLKIDINHSAEYVEGAHYIPVLAEEIKQLSLEYPIVFLKDQDTGQFGLVALLGFESGENLYIQQGAWRAHYYPCHLRRQPFAIGVNQRTDNTPNKGLIAIETESPRIIEENGQALFTEAGEATDYLKYVEQVLQQIAAGTKPTELFVKAIVDANLIEASSITVKRPNGEEKKYNGLYTINTESLQALDDSKLRELYDSRFLQACYLIDSSGGHISRISQYMR